MYSLPFFRAVARVVFFQESLFMRKFILCAGIAAVFMSCMASYHYSFFLRAVDRPKATSEKYGPVQIEKSPDSTAVRISDSCVDVLVTITTNQVEFVCRNRTDRSIKIDWEKAAYINPYGVRKRVIHRGIVYARKSDPQTPSIIRKGETLSDYLLPSENVNVYLYGSGGFTIYPLFSSRDFGRNAQVILPLEVDGAVNEYVFQFNISSVQ
jgi:hypothetical protein